MCGILGLIQSEPGPIDAGTILEMSASIEHRGPDDEGYLFADHRTGETCLRGGAGTPATVYGQPLPYCPREALAQHPPQGRFSVALGHRRLSIIDVSAGGHQPLSNEDGSVWVAYNGEVYNFGEIRTELAGKGYRFVSQSDTEVLLHAYEEWGTSCLERFNGMFSFALLDLRQRRLFCARDRFGIKPFYYAWTERGLVFASELKAVLASRWVPAKPSAFQLHTYLRSGVDDSRETYFEDILPLQPGHLLSLELDGSPPAIERYYDIPVGRGGKPSGAVDYARGFYERLESAVRYRLIADVPVGTCLSGGLDSSSIACMVDRLMREDGLKIAGTELQNTYSARYDDPVHDEGEYIDEVVRSTGCKAHSTFPNGATLLEDVRKFIWHHEEPFESTSIYAQWSVFDLVKRSKAAGVKVTLDGQGGDEVLAGYHRYFATHGANLLAHGHLGAFHRELEGIQRLHGYTKLSSAAKAFTVLVPMGLKNAIRPWTSKNNRPDWLSREFDAQFDGDPKVGALDHEYYGWDTGNVFEWDLYRSVTLGIPRLLRYADRNSMAHSIESRVPFLDHELVEYCFTLPDDQKIDAGMTKMVLREAMAGLLPESVRMRQSKIGFSTPQDAWFRAEMRGFIEQTIQSESFAARPYWRADRVRELVRRNLDGGPSVHADVWKWINVELWLRLFVD